MSRSLCSLWHIANHLSEKPSFLNALKLRPYNFGVMNRLDQLFQEKQENVLNIYFTAGYPNLDSTNKILVELHSNGADMVEVGMPYSDPLADGPTIQESGSIALKNGLTLPILFDQLIDIRQQTQKPIVLMGYLNQLLQYGFQKFCADAAACGVDGLIIPDMPLHEYETEHKAIMDKYGLHAIFLITPRTPEDRIRKIDSLSKGFLYVVSDSSITGSSVGLSSGQINYFKRIRSMGLANPLLIGFGIKDRESFTTACQYANGAIIGSAFIRHLGGNPDSISPFINSILGNDLGNHA